MAMIMNIILRKCDKCDAVQPGRYSWNIRRLSHLRIEGRRN